uniref:Polyprotein-1 n=1 Tax=Tetranychus truncatus TaxID=93132 RepID=A0A3G5ANT1_9ACAR|nr:polyprotein-1 [Tetranychus truncatus]
MSKFNQDTPFNTTNYKNVNSISLEHNEPLVEHTLGKHPILSSQKTESMSDPSGLTTTQLLHKPIVFANDVSWKVEDAINHTVYTQSLLNIFETLNRSPGGQNLRGNAFFRSGARIELKLTSSPFHSGRLVFYYIPPGVRTLFRESIYSKVQFPCVYVDAGNSTTGILDIPFVTIKDFFATYHPDDYSDFGDIVVAVLNPLRVGTGGPTSVQLALTLHPTQNDICLPVLAHELNITQENAVQLQGLDEIIKGMINDGSRILDSHDPVDLIGGTQDLPAHLVKILRDLIKTSSSGDATKMPNLPPSSVLPAPEALDKPKYNEPPPNPNNTTTITKVNDSAPTLSNITGMSTEHLSLIPEKTIITSNPSQEMNLLRVAQTPSLIRIGEWTDSNDSGTILFKTPIDPMVSPFLPSGGSNGVYYPTYLSHVVAPFAFWRGSIDYHFSFAGTEQHKGKIIVAWIPFDSLNTDTHDSSILGRSPTIEEMSLFPNEVFDLSLNKEFSFSVPYNSETPFRKVGETNTRINTTDGEVFGDDSTDESLGVLYMAVYNKLSHPSTVSSTINFNVYVKAGGDFQFRCLRFNADFGNQYQKINYVTLQGLDVVYETTREGMAQEPVNRVGVSDARVTKSSFQFDDSEERLGVLLQKYYPQFAYRVDIEAANTLTVSIASLPGLVFRSQRDPDPALNPDPRWRNLIAHFRDIYAFWQGSLNYFIIHNTTVNNPILLSVSHDPTSHLINLKQIDVGQASLKTKFYYAPIQSSVPMANDEVDLSETAIYSHLSNLRVNPTIEITTAHRSIYRRLYTADSRIGSADLTDQDETIGNIDLLYSNPSTENVSLSAVVYQSIGDDFQFKYLIPPPSLKSRR